MIKFETDFFQKINFTPNQVNNYFRAANHDLQIARKSSQPEVIFEFSYKALLRFGIALIAKNGFKVRSLTGHHLKILEKMAKILDNENVIILGNKMRQMRNFNFYDEGMFVSEKDAEEYLKFVDSIIKSKK